ncbi:Haloacid dehalogenase-like hydrolase domain-containing protein 3 OS=Danio rerio GN=hdhd3 PE=2 SV=1 [Rhizoctonia solani AG-1 IB]|uniref:Haloacid dehalogenase-like hydrolase domain-containing protein 3 n=1 Tax=Thanatephorus cucumeris (strain AG1-IB / isolate 7/3/14) TaxID=1108050 RepID=A0A0B7FWY1_THACB|nr:Haloacid dehalogenase-like hydrolase domain-containing protein 3 OS=Danio rerio GN=hdhd3 PE=2 SV=1 [Rhizoctonia solani AG-1 IB]
MAIKAVFFDALHTIVQPRRPIFEQYHRVLAPKVGPLNPASLRGSFKTALRQVQRERPAYGNGSGKTGPVESDSSRNWWEEVVKKTALGAGADPQRTEEHLDEAVTELLHIFSSKEGYKLSDGALQTITTLNAELGIRTGLVSNCDYRIVDALRDLQVTNHFDPMIVSELEKCEKPDPRMWQVACQRAGVKMEEVVHVGDEFDADVLGATRAGAKAIWYCPPTQDTRMEEDTTRVVPKGVAVVGGLVEVVDVVRQWNRS